MGAIDDIRDRKAARVQEKRDLQEFAEIKKVSSSDEQRRTLQEAYDLGVADSAPRYRTPVASVDNILSNQGAINWFEDTAEPDPSDLGGVSSFAAQAPAIPQEEALVNGLGSTLDQSPRWDPSLIG